MSNIYVMNKLQENFNLEGIPSQLVMKVLVVPVDGTGCFAEAMDYKLWLKATED